MIVFILSNSRDLDKMPLFAAFYLGFHCLPMYSFRVSSIQKVKGLMPFVYFDIFITVSGDITNIGLLHLMVDLQKT